MNTPEITVIVPVYRVEKYLRRCVDSLLAQAYQDLEIILVDDGSPDDCGGICDAYSLLDSRVRVIHKENGGLSDARNAGIAAAKGRYLTFVDSDDLVHRDLCLRLHRLAVDDAADIAVAGIENCYQTGHAPQHPTLEHFVCTGHEALSHMLSSTGQIPGSACAKLYRRELFASHRFPKGKTYEDAFLLPDLMLDSGVVSVTTEPLYFYWHREDSITTEPFTQRSMDIIDAYRYTRDVVLRRCPALRDAADFRLFWAHFVVLDRMLLTERYQQLPEYTAVVSYLREHWREIMACPYFQRSRRIAALVLRCSVPMYRALSLANGRRRKENG